MSKKSKDRKLDHAVLATGESTGHGHRAVGRGVALYERPDASLYLRAPSGAEVVHEEHGTLALPPGEYDRVIVKEYDHLTEESREVRD